MSNLFRMPILVLLISWVWATKRKIIEETNIQNAVMVENVYNGWILNKDVQKKEEAREFITWSLLKSCIHLDVKKNFWNKLEKILSMSL